MAKELQQNVERLISSYLASSFVLGLGLCSNRRKILGRALWIEWVFDGVLRQEWASELISGLKRNSTGH